MTPERRGGRTLVAGMSARAMAFATLAVALAATGCGEERGPGGRVTSTFPQRAAPPPAAIGKKAVAIVNVSLSDYRLQPGYPRVPRPGLIAFVATNDGTTTHALAVDGPKGEVKTPPLLPGERRTLMVRLPAGTYKWLCPLAGHERLGMVGRVRVAE